MVASFRPRLDRPRHTLDMWPPLRSDVSLCQTKNVDKNVLTLSDPPGGMLLSFFFSFLTAILLRCWSSAIFIPEPEAEADLVLVRCPTDPKILSIERLARSLAVELERLDCLLLAEEADSALFQRGTVMWNVSPPLPH